MRCHDCDVEEGELHGWGGYGCDMEVCPKCMGQLLSCDCSPKYISKDRHCLILGKEEKMFERIIWVEVPVLCRLCGMKYPDFFKVSDKEWETFVPKHIQHEVLCWGCYEHLKKMRRGNE